MFYADLHIHSKYSRATSSSSDLEHHALWATRKGIKVLGTGDFTHPAWFSELQEKLLPAEPGLFRLRPEILSSLTTKCHLPLVPDVRFMLQVEVSTIYRKEGRTHKVHHLIYTPDFEKARHISSVLARMGNLAADGRPILGLDSKHLLEIVLEAGEGCFLIPAHIWTPWFSVLGSKSGFDSLDACYGDLAHHIFAVETGLSSDPVMNRMVSRLDRFALISNSDAHSPQKIGREATLFNCDLSYFGIMQSLHRGTGFSGTVEFFPEEGKYHFDGCKRCGVAFHPSETRDHQCRCPSCGKNLTVGVLNRVCELADRDEEHARRLSPPYQKFIPLPEVLSELYGVGPQSKKVTEQYQRLIQLLGPELYILGQLPLSDLATAGNSLFAEAISRMRRQEVFTHNGYDGTYGKIEVFAKGEISQLSTVYPLFPSLVGFSDSRVADENPSFLTLESRVHENESATAEQPTPAHPFLSELDRNQRRATEIIKGPLIIHSGPGTGKTRTLTYRVASLIHDHRISASQFLVLTTTHKSARETEERLLKLLEEEGRGVNILTLHALGLQLLNENQNRLNLGSIHVVSQAQRVLLIQEEFGVAYTEAIEIARELSYLKRRNARSSEMLQRYDDVLTKKGLLDRDDLILKSRDLLQGNPDIRDYYHTRFTYLSVDDFQELDQQQYALIKLLISAQENICFVGDLNQAIDNFELAVPDILQQFRNDFPQSIELHLDINYRSQAKIVAFSNSLLTGTTPSTHSVERAFHHGGRVVELHEFANEYLEAAWIAKTISSLVSNISTEGRHTALTALSFGDICILVRRPSSMPLLTDALSRIGIPLSIRGDNSFLDEPLVEAFMSHLTETSEELSLRDRVLSASKRLLDTGHSAFSIPPLLTTVLHLVARCRNSLTDLTTLLSTLQETELIDTRAERVSILTLPAARGLEFPVVFIPECDDQAFPLSDNKSDLTDHEILRERNLLFLGISRAGRELYLTRSLTRTQHGVRRRCSLSRFLQHVDQEALLTISGSDRLEGRLSSDQLDLFGKPRK